MSECVSPIDDYSSTTVPNKTTDTSVTDGTKSVETSLDYCCNKNNDLLMNNTSRSDRAKYVIIDGKKIRSALASGGKKERRRVNFPNNDRDLVTGCLEPANPWEHAEDVSRDILISSYKESCERHHAEPLKKVLDQLEELDISNGRCDDLSLKHEVLDKKHCEPLEEILKRIQFRQIDLESSGLTDESAETIFDMIEYYESAKHVNISSNGNIATRGWQACGQMIKKTLCLEQLDAKSIVLTQQHMNILKRPLQLVSHLQILKVENCGLAGRAFVILVAALKLNTGLKELYLADNGLAQEDAIQLGSLLRVNNCLQLLDISNNNIRDEGVHNILDGLVYQGYDGSTKGLKILILWNNHLTKICSGYFAETIAQSKSLETLNIGHNALSDDFLDICKDVLKHNTVLLQLGVQATGLMNKGIMALAEVVGKNESLQRIDLRDNHIQLTGLTFLCLAMKKNVTITQIDLDDRTWSKAPSMMETYLSIVSEIRSYCARNDEPLSTDSSTSESGSPQHRSRLSSVNSRKISLTCQTLPRSPTVLPSVPDPTLRSTTTLEPKRTTGGRLRSPAPSPIPSPVASPIPSPSRNRFVVSRVSEASLSSTNSSASSSPVTPPSLASSPTCFFPATTSGTSRFRVTIIESPNPTKNIVTPANTNVTIGFNYRIDHPERIDSDDSDSVFRSEEEDSRLNSESSLDPSSDERITTPDSGAAFDADRTITTSSRFPYASTSSDEDKTSPKSSDVIPDEESSTIVHQDVNKTLTEPLEPLVLVQEPEIPKQSSLERLLGLFQNPGTLFTAEKPEIPLKNTLQGSMTSMMALGDRFHQYLRDTTRQPLQRSISDASKSSIILQDPVKSLSIDQLFSLEAKSEERRLSGVQEDDVEQKIQNLGNYETNVPVLTYKSEYSIMIGECESVIEDIVSKVSETICDNQGEDSINEFRVRENVHNDKLLSDSVEDDVKEILQEILNAVDHTGEDCSHNHEISEIQIELEDQNALETSKIEERIVLDDHIVLEVMNRPILADDLLEKIGENLTSRSCSVLEELDNPQTSRSPTNLFINKSSVHRNSQDSGIEEANVSISDDNLEISPQIRDSFQESLDSGIDSECSSVCNRIETVQVFNSYDIPEINSCEILVNASLFVNNDARQETDSQMIGDTDMTIIGAKLSTEEQMVSSSTSVE